MTDGKPTEATETTSSPAQTSDTPERKQAPTMQDIWAASSAQVNDYTPKKKKRWGLPSAIMGFVLMLGFQLIVGVVLVILVTIQAASQGIYDTYEIQDITLDMAFSAPVLIISAFTMYLSWLIVMFWASYKNGAKSFAKDFWIRFKWTDILWGLGLGLALRGADLGSQWIMQEVIGLDLSGAGNTSPIVSQTGFAYFMLAIVIGCICAPLFEEMFIRGHFFQALIRYFRKNNQVPTTVIGRFVHSEIPGLWNFHKKVKHVLFKLRYWLSCLISGTVFGSMHFQATGMWTDWLIVTQTGLIGVFLAWMVLKTKRVGTAIAIHVVFNVTGIIIATYLQNAGV